ncbi:resolvase [Oceaniglobus trochenteri]|uniref:resolvase n=1 Tax=Oceaniglobus trochenteri TaxID=2763260 RepID=UPI001CFFDAB2|nr:resolvase [Oceaniglobus trochenteri]
MEDVDLFGNPTPKGKGERGRPAFVVTEKDRNKVKMLLALGWSNTRVANALVNPSTGRPVSLATLKRYFRAELKERERMRDRLDARLLEMAMEMATAGNVAALKEFIRMIEKSDLMNVRVAIDEAQAEEERPKRLGKKEMAQRDAEATGDSGDWGSDLRFDGRAN